MADSRGVSTLSAALKHLRSRPSIPRPRPGTGRSRAGGDRSPVEDPDGTRSVGQARSWNSQAVTHGYSLRPLRGRVRASGADCAAMSTSPDGCSNFSPSITADCAESTAPSAVGTDNCRGVPTPHRTARRCTPARAGIAIAGTCRLSQPAERFPDGTGTRSGPEPPFRIKPAAVRALGRTSR